MLVREVEKLKEKDKLEKNIRDQETVDIERERNRDELLEEKDWQGKIEYIREVCSLINNADNIENLKKTFSEAINSKRISAIKLQNFDNNINKIRNSLNDIDNFSNLVMRRNILDNIVNVFINKNRPIFKIGDNKNYNVDYFKNKVLYDFYQEYGAKQVVLDVMKLFIDNDEIEISDYQLFDAELKMWLIDFISKNYLKTTDNEELVNKNKEGKPSLENSKGLKEKVYNIPYLGFDDSFFTQLGLIQNRKGLVEKSRRYELLLLDRKYGRRSSRKNFFQVKNEDENKNKTEDGNLFYKNTKLNYNTRLTYEDRMYSSVNVFYNIKYNRVIREEKELIDKYRKMIRGGDRQLDRTPWNKLKNKFYDRPQNRKTREYLSRNLDIKEKLDPIKEWTSEYSNLIDSDKLGVPNILNVTSEKVKDIILVQQYGEYASYILNPKKKITNFKKSDIKPNKAKPAKRSLFSGLVVKGIAQVLMNDYKDSKKDKSNNEKPKSE